MVNGPVHHQVNLAVRFLLELGALAAFFLWGMRVGGGLLGVLLGVGAAVIAAVVWGVFVSPQASIHLPLAGRLAVEVVFFGTAALALVVVGRPLLGVWLLGLAAANRALIQAWGQDERLRTDN